MKNLISGPSIERTIRMSYKDLQSEVLFKSEPYSSALRTPSATSLDKHAPVCGVWHRTPPPPELDGVFFFSHLHFLGGGEHTVGGWVRTCYAHGLNLCSCRLLWIHSRDVRRLRGGAGENGGNEMQTKGWREEIKRKPTKMQSFFIFF